MLVFSCMVNKMLHSWPRPTRFCALCIYSSKETETQLDLCASLTCQHLWNSRNLDLHTFGCHLQEFTDQHGAHDLAHNQLCEDTGNEQPR